MNVITLARACREFGVRAPATEAGTVLPGRVRSAAPAPCPGQLTTLRCHLSVAVAWVSARTSECAAFLRGGLARQLRPSEGGIAIRLTGAEYEVLEFMANDAEPTWIFLKEMPELGGDREALEAILRDLERRKLVDRTREPSVNPEAGPGGLDDWWALTPMGRQALRQADPPHD